MGVTVLVTCLTREKIEVSGLIGLYDVHSLYIPVIASMDHNNATAIFCCLVGLLSSAPE